jgi:hypothetical protein
MLTAAPAKATKPKPARRMPDATAGVATGLYWVATGKMPIEDLEQDEDLQDDKGQNDKDQDRDPWSRKDPRK